MADASSISTDPYASFSDPATPTPPAHDPYAEFSDPAPVTHASSARDPYASFSDPVNTQPPPLSEDDFQQKMKTRWGSMLTGQSMASPTDITEMQASGKFTPEQIQSVQTETALRQQYIDEGAHPFANLADKAAGLAKNVTVLPRLWEAYKDISANPTGYANDAARVASGVTEGLSDAVTGAGEMAAAPLQYAYHKIFPPAPLTPEQQYQQWKINRVSSQQTPGYGAPHTTSRVQDSLNYLTGDPAESFAQPVAAASELASTAASLPLFEGTMGAAGAVGRTALKATGAAEIASKYAPTLSAFGDTAGAQAARIRNAANEAIEPGSTPLGAVDVTGPLSRAGTSAVNKIMEKAGDTISGTGKVANTIAEKIQAIPGMDSNAAQLLASAVLGPKAVIVAEGALKTLEKLGPKAVDLGDAMGRIATANPTDPFGRLMSIAADSDAPPWLKTFVKNPAIQFAAKAGTLGAGAAKGLATGAVQGAALSTVSGDSPEDTLENAMNFGAFGALHGGLSAKEGKVFNSNIGAVSKFITDSLAAGTSPETLKTVPLSDILQAALIKHALPDQAVRFSTPMDAGSPFGPAGDAVGQAGYYDPANKTLWIDPTKRAPGSTLLHESYHPIFDNLGQQPEIKSSIDLAFKNSGSTLDEFKQQYASKVFPNDPQAAAEYLKARDAQNPDWAYPEVLSESAAHHLDGKDLLPAMQGQVINQSATQAALAGVKGWLNDMGVDLQKKQSTGTIFPDFTKSLNDPGLRQLTYRLLRAQRDTLTSPLVENPGVPLKPQDMGTPKAPLYTGPNGEQFNAYGRMVPGVKGPQFKAWPASEIKRRGLAEKVALRKYFPEAGKLVTSMPAGLEADPNITPWTKASLRAQFDGIQSKDKLSLWYHRLNSENSATSDKSRAVDLARTQGNVQVSYQSGQPLGIKRTAKDNIISQFHSEEAENQKLAAWAQRTGPLSLDLWNGDIGKAKADIQTYLENHATGQPGDANGIGAAKRDVINALLAGGNKEFEAKNPLRAQIKKADRQGIIRDLRADRMESPSAEPTQRSPANWESLKHNLSPSSGPLYHGTKESYKPEDITTNKRMVGIHFTESPEIAAQYGKVRAYNLSADAKILDLLDTDKLWDFVKKWFVDENEDKKITDELEQYVKQGGLPQYDMLYGHGYSDLIAGHARTLGYDAVKLPEEGVDLEKGEGLHNTTVVVNPKVLTPHSEIKFSPSDDPNAIKAAAARDRKTGRIFPGRSHIAARDRSPKSGEDLEDGFVTNSGKFLSRDQAYERAVAMKQYKPTDDDSNFVTKKLYGLTSERFNKQNPNQAYGAQWMPEIAGPKPGNRMGRYSPAEDEDSTSLRGGNHWQNPDGKFLPADYSHAEAAAHILGKASHDRNLDSNLEHTKELLRKGWSRIVNTAENIYVESNSLNKEQEKQLTLQAIQQEKPLVWEKPGLFSKSKTLYNPPSRQRHYSPAESKTRTPDEGIRAQAADYTKEAGISHSPFTGYAPLNEDLGKRVADAYEAAPHIPDDPKVKAAYQALATETRAQWDYLTKQGVKFEPWTKKGQPYKNSAEMREDVKQNKHLWFFPTENGYGQTGAEKAASNNPMPTPTGVEVNGMPLVANDMFRAVHDYFGHAKEGYEFGPRGEYNAYLAHSRMFSDTARLALTAETMGQNSWVNFGKHLRDEAGNIAKKGEKGYVAPQDRPFAEQKATVLPEDLTKESLAPAEKGFSFSPSENPLAIKSAAILDTKTKKIYEGEIHASAYQKYFDENPTAKSPDEGGHIIDEGFVTNNGKFLDREQANARARRLKQIPENRPKFLEAYDFLDHRKFSPSENPEVKARANHVHEVAERFLDNLGEGKIEGIYLIGSRAEGKIHANSDWDWLVVGDGLDSAEEERLEKLENGERIYGMKLDSPVDRRSSFNDIIFSSKPPELGVKVWGDKSADDKEKLSYPMEMAPGKASGILPALADAPYAAKEQYQQDITKAMKPLFDAFEAKPGETTRSSYKNSAGETEHNPTTTVEVSADKARLFGLLHGLFTSQEAVAGGYSEVKPGDWQPTHPSSFSESPDYAEKIKAAGPEAQALLAELAPKIEPAIQAVNEKWGKKLKTGIFSPAIEGVEADEAGFGNYWLDPKGLFHHVGDHGQFALARLGDSVKLREKAENLFGISKKRLTAGHLGRAAEDTLKDQGWVRISYAREQETPEVFVNGKRLNDSQHTALDVWSKKNPDVKITNTSGANTFSPRGGDYSSRFRDIEEQRREDNLPPDAIDMLSQEIGTAKIRLSDARKIRKGFKPHTETLKRIFAPDGKMTLDKAAQAMEQRGVTGDEDLFERIEKAAAAREKLWEEHVKNTAPRKPFDQLEYEKAQNQPFSPASEDKDKMSLNKALKNKDWRAVSAIRKSMKIVPAQQKQQP